MIHNTTSSSSSSSSSGGGGGGGDGWVTKLPESNSFSFSTTFLSVLTMMDLVLTEPEKGPIKSFVEKNYIIIIGMAIVKVAEHAKNYEN
jgi:hypothetical protein